MALTKETTTDQIEVVGEHKLVQVRTRTKISEDDTVISSSLHRHVLVPRVKSGDPATWGDTDISGESTEVQAICNAVWTSAVKTAYETHMDAQES